MLKNNQTLLTTIIISILIHLVILGLFHYSVTKKVAPTIKKTAKQPLKAILVFELPIEPVSVPDTPTEPTIKPESKPQNNVATKKIATVIDKIHTTSEIINKPQPSLTSPNIPPTITNSPVPINSLFTGTAGKHLKHYNSLKETQLAQDVIQDFNRQKRSPDLDLKRTSSFLSEDEKLIKDIAVRANCSGSGKKILVGILGTLGGNIKCSSAPPINPFIQNRINKVSSHIDYSPKPASRKHLSIVVKQ